MRSLAFIATGNCTSLARSVGGLNHYFGTEPYGRHLAVYMPSGPVLHLHEYVTYHI